MRPSTPASFGRLRILHVVGAYYPAVRYGGPIRSVHGLAAALARQGHDVHVYTTSLDGDSDLNVPIDQPVILDGVSVRYFRVTALRRLCWAPAFGRRLRGSVAEFDVVHIHGVYLWPLLVAARAAARAGVPYVVTPRGMLVRDLISRKSRWVKTAWIQLFERTTLARAAAVHVTAELEGQELRAMGLPAQRIACIPNGVEWPRGHEALEAGPYSKLPGSYVLFLSRINWKKGLDRLITAWRSIPDIPLVIAGNDDEEYQPKLLELARTLGVADRVIFLGPVSDAHKWSLYERALMFVLPSYSENFGNVVAEAMAMGCPVVVTSEVGIAPLVEAAGAGVVTDGAPEKLAVTIRELLLDPQRRQEMGRRGVEAAKTRLSWEGVVASTEALYREMLRQDADGAAAVVSS
jgi:glycosyltransferase involved in cell wall biosynthesis